MKLQKRIFIVGVVFLINYLLDRVTKVIAENTLTLGQSHSYVGDLMRIELIYNNGMFLSMGNQLGNFLKILVSIVIPLLACLAAIVFLLLKDVNKVYTILITSIAAGGLANIQDRIFNHFNVTDFLNFGIGNLRTGILNVADMSITFGVILLAIYEFMKPTTKKN